MVLMPEEVYKESIYFVSSTFEDSLLTKKKKSQKEGNGKFHMGFCALGLVWFLHPK
jgi:hypothetical protein